MFSLHDPSEWLNVVDYECLDLATSIYVSSTSKLWQQATNVGVQGDIVGILAQLHLHPTHFSHGNQFWFGAIRHFFCRPQNWGWR